MFTVKCIGTGYCQCDKERKEEGITVKFCVSDVIMLLPLMILFFREVTQHQFFFLARQPPVGQGLLIHYVSRTNTTTHHSRQDSPGQVISSSQRPLPDNTQHSQQTDIHARGGNRTHNLSRRAATDLRFRPRGCWDRLIMLLLLMILFFREVTQHQFFLVTAHELVTLLGPEDEKITIL